MSGQYSPARTNGAGSRQSSGASAPPISEVMYKSRLRLFTGPPCTPYCHSRCCASGGNVATVAFVAVTVVAGRGSCSGVMSYQLPQIVSASPANLPSSGSAVVLIGGLSFGGASDRSIRSRVGLSTLFRSIWQSDSAVVCMATPGGGVRVYALLTAGSSAGSTSMLFSYDVFVPKPSTGGVSNVPSSGQTLITVAGSGASLFGYSAQAVVGNSACRGTAWAAESSVMCRTSPGVGKGLSMIVSVMLGRGSANVFLSYDAFAGSSVSPTNAPSTGGVRLYVTGSGAWHCFVQCCTACWKKRWSWYGVAI